MSQKKAPNSKRRKEKPPSLWGTSKIDRCLIVFDSILLIFISNKTLLLWWAEKWNTIKGAVLQEK